WDFDVSNIDLSSPGSGASVALPRDFQWVRRTTVSTDSYLLTIYDPQHATPFVQTSPLGYVNSFTLGALPHGLSNGVQYVWEIWAQAPDGGYGFSYVFLPIIF